MLNWEDYLDANQSQFVDDLLEFVLIPSASASENYVKDVVTAGNWVVQRPIAAGVENVWMMATEGHPVVYGDWLHANPRKPTVLIYGHFDVQPAEPYDLWQTPPFLPKVRDGKVWGRGASDDKGAC